MPILPIGGPNVTFDFDCENLILYSRVESSWGAVYDVRKRYSSMIMQVCVCVCVCVCARVRECDRFVSRPLVDRWVLSLHYQVEKISVVVHPPDGDPFPLEFERDIIDL